MLSMFTKIECEINRDRMKYMYVRATFPRPYRNGLWQMYTQKPQPETLRSGKQIGGLEQPNNKNVNDYLS